MRDALPPLVLPGHRPLRQCEKCHALRTLNVTHSVEPGLWAVKHQSYGSGSETSAGRSTSIE